MGNDNYHYIYIDIAKAGRLHKLASTVTKSFGYYTLHNLGRYCVHAFFTGDELTLIKLTLPEVTIW